MAEPVSPARRLLRVGAWGVVGVLAPRGGGGLIASAFRLGQATDLFRHYDLRIHSPLCVGLAAMSSPAIWLPSTEGSDPAQTDPAQ